MARHLAKSEHKRRTAVLVPLLFLLSGALALAVPLSLRLSADWRNARATSAMSGAAQTMDEGERLALLANAHAYNDLLAGVDPADDEVASGVGADGVRPYETQLDAGDAAIAWIEIPRIGLRLRVFRGTGDEVLAAGVGHLEGSSLPVGGQGTHCVLTGHSGLATSRMFDDIRQLDAGDVIVLHTLGEEMAYEVYGSEVVLPEELDGLGIVPGDDLVTLVTCTPYGVNDHRLLVHARRCELPARDAGAASEVGLGTTALPLVLLTSLAVVVVAMVRRGRRTPSVTSS